KLDNKTTRDRDDSEVNAFSALLGLEAEAAKILPQGIDPTNAINVGNQHSTSGDGKIDRKEAISILVAGVITQILPNGNLVVFGRQEIKVNAELREVMVTGIVRPEDIDYTNTISHEKIAELRVAYGGRGTLSDIQQPRIRLRFRVVSRRGACVPSARGVPAPRCSGWRSAALRAVSN
ncbi:MAG: flgH, partial [Rhodospirillales bacterium]|nr:flgH [Rhodospirillales bacterium]